MSELVYTCHGCTVPFLLLIYPMSLLAEFLSQLFKIVAKNAGMTKGLVPSPVTYGIKIGRLKHYNNDDDNNNNNDISNKKEHRYKRKKERSK